MIALLEIVEKARLALEERKADRASAEVCRRRPVAAYGIGLVMYWAHVGSFVPAVANALCLTPGLRDIVKAFFRISRRTSVPRFSRITFVASFARRAPRNPHGPRVILWPDTFDNYFDTSTADAAVTVLERAGYRVIVPQATLCCGRTMYEFGMFDLARTLGREVLVALGPYLREGVCVVGLEPGCVSVFKERLVEMLPYDSDAKRLRDQTYLLGDFLTNVASFDPPSLARRAVAARVSPSDRALLERMGVGLDERSGDRAGATSDAGALVMSDEFCCRHELACATQRQTFHLARVIELAFRSADADARSAIEPRFSNESLERSS